MARVTVEDCLEQIPDQFAVVHLASARYRQLHKGVTPLVDAPKNKNVVVALREIAGGSIRFREDVDEAVAAARQKLVSQRLQNLSAADELNAELGIVPTQEQEAAEEG